MTKFSTTDEVNKAWARIPFTDEEVMILRAISEGKTDKEILSVEKFSSATLHRRVQSIYLKCGNCVTRPALRAKWTRLGLT